MTIKQMQTKMIWDVVYYLADKAKIIIDKARADKETENPSGTQWDSFGAAVFYNGRLYYTLKSADPKKDLTTATASRTIETLEGEANGRHKGYKDIPDGTGREWVQLYVNDIKKSSYIPKKGFALVVFNAAFYSGVQEHGQKLKNGGVRKWKILSQVTSQLEDLKSEFKGATLRGINLDI